MVFYWQKQKKNYCNWPKKQIFLLPALYWDYLHFLADHPLYVGMLGMHGNYGPNILTNEADVIIAVGMRFDDRVTGNLATYAKQAKIIHIEIDPAEINKNVQPKWLY